MMHILNSHKSIIWLNGTPPSQELLKHVNMMVPIIASDGAAHKVQQCGLQPSFIVGDGDSFDGNQSSIFIYAPDQNFTDCEKSIMFAREQSLLPALLLGVCGGELDHTLGNMQAILKHTQDNDLYFLDAYASGIKIGIPLTHSIMLETVKGTTVSLIAFEPVTVSSCGLQWELSNHTLRLQETLGLRNKTNDKKVEIMLHQGRVLLIADVLMG